LLLAADLLQENEKEIDRSIDWSGGENIKIPVATCNVELKLFVGQANARQVTPSSILILPCTA